MYLKSLHLTLNLILPPVRSAQSSFYSERWRHDRLGLKFEFGFLSSLNKFNMTNYTYAESISSDTETKTHRSTSDKLALVRDN